MYGQTDIRKRLASLLDEVAVNEGAHRTLFESVEVAPRDTVVAPRTDGPSAEHRGRRGVGNGFST